MRRIFFVVMTGCWAWALICGFRPAVAQVASAPQITLDSFNGIYHLSRDASGLSFLTVEEDINARFPSNGNFTGITRQIPRTFQGRSVEIKVLSVQDAAGNAIPYKTTNNKDNLVVATGDPSINLFGSQILKINYQTKGVVNLAASQDELLLNVNGRGWNQSFGRVSATLHIPTSFATTLKSTAACYLSINNLKTTNCQMSSKKTPSEFLVTTKASPVAAHQALVMRVDFKPATFTDSRSNLDIRWLIIGLLALVLVSLSGYRLLLRKK